MSVPQAKQPASRCIVGCTGRTNYPSAAVKHVGPALSRAVVVWTEPWDKGLGYLLGAGAIGTVLGILVATGSSLGLDSPALASADRA